MELADIGRILATILSIVGGLITAAAGMVYAERKVAALIQQRNGPNRVGPWGLLQPFADVLKLFIKEDIVPSISNKFAHFLAPVISLLVALSAVALIPFAHNVYIADINIGILYTLAITSIAVYGITLSGWSSNSKYALLGGLRSSAQMISYELAMGLSVVSVILLTNHFSTKEEYLRLSSIIDGQTTVWNIFRNPIGFLIFLTCAFAECNRAPFDLAEAEQELVGGFHTEYSSMKFGTFFLSEYVNMFMASAVTTVLFLGGYRIPFQGLFADNINPTLLSVLEVMMFLAKTSFLVFVFIWVRWTLPRFKYNQLMNIGWKVFLPLALLNLVIIAAVLLFIK